MSRASRALAKAGALFVAINILAGLSACDNGEAERNDTAGSALEQAAIERGLIPGADVLIFDGRYERRSDIGIDRFCSFEENGEHRIGAYAAFGPNSFCEARGKAKRDGELVEIAFAEEGTCEFDARFDGIELVFPGKLPDGCAAYCTDRASFSGVSFFFVEEGVDAARTVPGRKFTRLCE